MCVNAKDTPTISIYIDFRVPNYVKIQDKDELECKLRTKVQLEHLKLELSIKAERMRFLL